ncbi:50S ribosomal protein L10 [Myxococcota bacterium]|nr:50S ribosomal protein L10 [Myxococcota bacterium]
MLLKAQKIEQVETLKEKFSRANSVYVADYRGLDVQSVNELRRQIHKEGGEDYEYRVVKNSVLRRAADGSEFEAMTDHFNGPTVIALSYGDPVGLAKILSTFSEDHEAFELKGAVLDGSSVTPTEIGVLATLPSLEELRGKIVGLLQAPGTKLVRLLGTPGEQLARLTDARREQLGSEG